MKSYLGGLRIRNLVTRDAEVSEAFLGVYKMFLELSIQGLLSYRVVAHTIEVLRAAVLAVSMSGTAFLAGVIFILHSALW